MKEFKELKEIHEIKDRTLKYRGVKPLGNDGLIFYLASSTTQAKVHRNREPQVIALLVEKVLEDKTHIHSVSHPGVPGIGRPYKIL